MTYNVNRLQWVNLVSPGTHSMLPGQKHALLQYSYWGVSYIIKSIYSQYCFQYCIFTLVLVKREELCMCISCISCAGIILCMLPANERWRYNVTSSLIGWPHTQNHPWYVYQRKKIWIILYIIPATCHILINTTQNVLKFTWMIYTCYKQ